MALRPRDRRPPTKAKRLSRPLPANPHLSPRTLATWLREWLETFPGKVFFGTDGYPYSDVMGWEESTWIAARNGREALGLALTGMLQDHEIDHPRAARIATGVLRENALAIYSSP